MGSLDEHGDNRNVKFCQYLADPWFECLQFSIERTHAFGKPNEPVALLEDLDGGGDRGDVLSNRHDPDAPADRDFKLTLCCDADRDLPDRLDSPRRRTLPSPLLPNRSSPFRLAQGRRRN